MNNPFERRATEQVRNEEAFLALVSPEPLNVYLKPIVETGRLYDRLGIIVGTPGSGKTTIAKLYEFPTLLALLRQRSNQAFRPLLSTMSDLQAIAGARPQIIACRLPLESDYAEIWEFPYAEDVRDGLLKSFIQARSMLAWFRHLSRAGYAAEAVEIVTTGTSSAAAEAIGGINGPSVLRRAEEVERQIYSAVGALVPPSAERIGDAAVRTYRPFDVIQRFRVQTADPEAPLELEPMLILDDAHTLSPGQFSALSRWLARRELLIRRWIMTRLDVLPADEAIASVLADQEGRTLPGLTTERDITIVPLQRTANRREHRQAFRRMAKDMANRYLSQMPQFASRRLDDLGNMLSNEPEHLSTSRLGELQKEVSTIQRALHVSEERKLKLQDEVKTFDPSQRDIGEDDRLAMLRILMHRYAKRVPQQQLFGNVDPEPARPLSADSTVYDASRLHLLHTFDRAFYFGIDDLCDASSENAEQFLRLAAVLVDALSTKLIRSRQAFLSSAEQNDLLRTRAEEFSRAWNFPHYDRVRFVVSQIASRCVEVSLEPNAWIGAGANAYGVPQEEFDQMPKKHPQLVKTLQYAVAYNAVNLIPRYECKNRLWCLMELGGILLLKHGLTLKRGGFIEGSVEELAFLDRSFPS